MCTGGTITKQKLVLNEIFSLTEKCVTSDLRLYIKTPQQNKNCNKKTAFLYLDVVLMMLKASF